MTSPELELRARRHAALGDPTRLAIIDELVASDRAPIELGARFGLASNLLAHHLDVLEEVGIIGRTRSSGDGRRRYVHLHREALADLAPGRSVTPGAALFVCSANSARSQLAAGLWTQLTDTDGQSAGTRPAAQVHPGAVAAAERAGLDLDGATPSHLDDHAPLPPLVITVCDQAHEEIGDREDWLHWSIPDPVPAGTRTAFDATVDELRLRITDLVGASR